jgi:hypothetical protein
MTTVFLPLFHYHHTYNNQFVGIFSPGILYLDQSIRITNLRNTIPEVTDMSVISKFSHIKINDHRSDKS